MNRQTILQGHPEARPGANKLTAALLAIYLVALFWILILKLGVRFSYMGNRNVNLIPFRYSDFITAETVSNVLVFVPLGLYAGVLFYRWPVAGKIFSFFATSLMVEGLQYFFAVGAFDSTDILTNTFGGTIGLLLYWILAKAFRNRVRAQRFINGMAAIGTVIILTLLLLLKLNLLPVRYQYGQA